MRFFKRNQKDNSCCDFQIKEKNNNCCDVKIIPKEDAKEKSENKIDEEKSSKRYSFCG